MSMPDDTVSSPMVAAPLLAPDSLARADLRVDYELGGVAVSDPSAGLMVKTWRAWTDGVDAWCAPNDTLSPTTHLVTGIDITEVSLCFDQNMRPTLAFVDADVTKLYWYDSLAAAHVVTSYPGVRSPMVCMDDKREEAISGGWSDDLFFYIKGGDLCYRQQRERFTVERVLGSGVAASSRIVHVGMGTNNRLQIWVRSSLAAAYVSLHDDELYLLAGSDVKMLDAPLTGTWRSRVFEAHEVGSMGWARVEAATYPVTLTVFGDGVVVANLTITSDEPCRLPAVRAREWQVEVSSAGRVLAVRLAGALEELEADDARYL